MKLGNLITVVFAVTILTAGLGFSKGRAVCPNGDKPILAPKDGVHSKARSDLKPVKVRHGRCGHEATYLVMPGDYFTTTCSKCGHLFMVSPEGVDAGKNKKKSGK